MSDLLAPGDGAIRPWQPPIELGTDPEPDRVRAAQRTSAADSSIEVIASAAPDWITELIDQVQYPTRMARRRALEDARVAEGWSPDSAATVPVLQQVNDGLEELFQRPWSSRHLHRSAVTAGQPLTGPLAAIQQSIAAQRLTAADHVDARPLGASTEGDAPYAEVDLLPQVGRVRWWSSTSRKALAAGLAFLLMVSVALVSVFIYRGGAEKTVARGTVGGAAQELLLVSVVSAGKVSGVSLLAAGAGGSQQVLIPSRLLVDVPGAGRMPVAQSLAVGAAAPSAAIADALGVRISGSWVLDRAALTALIDRVGGIRVDVDVDIPVSAKTGAALAISAGKSQRLSGKQAATYATYLGSDDPETTRLARQERVVTAVLATLPTAADQRRALLGELPGVGTGTGLGTVTSITGKLHDAAQAGSLPSVVVPVREIDSGGAVAAYGLDTVGAAKLTRSRLAGAAIREPLGGRVRVLVQNGVGKPGLGEAARARLVAVGQRYVGGGNVSGFGVQETVVLLPDGSSTSRARGLAVARALGLTATSLRISESAPTVADVVVVLGQDFKPK